MHRSLRLAPVAMSAAIAAAVAGACAQDTPPTGAERLARGRALVRGLSARLGAIPQLTTTTTEIREVLRPSGVKERLEIHGLYTMRRPDRFYFKQTGGREWEAWYNGRKVTLAIHSQRVFAQAPMPETLDRTLDAIAERYDFAFSLADLFYSSAEKALLSDGSSGGYAGTDTVAGTPCHHLAFRDHGVEWELWLPVEGDQLPRRFKVIQTKTGGRPLTDVTFTQWNLTPSLTDATFTPHVPDDYEGIAMLQRAAAVRHLPASPAP